MLTLACLCVCSAPVQLIAYLRDEKGEDGEPAVVELDSVRKMQEILKQVKVMFRTLEIEASEGGRRGGTALPGYIDGGRASGVGGAGAGDSSYASGGGEGVGELEGSGGFALGLAPSHARPVGGIEARSPGLGAPPQPVILCTSRLHVFAS